MASKFLKDFFIRFFDTFEQNRPLVNLKNMAVNSSSEDVFQSVSESILMGYLNALYAVLKAHVGVAKTVSQSKMALYYMQKTQNASAGAAELLLVELNQFYLLATKKPTDDLTAEISLASKVHALLPKLSQTTIDECEQRGAAASSYKILSSSDSFSKLEEVDVESPTKAIAEFGKFILQKLSEMEKIPTTKFGGNEVEVMLQYSQDLLAKLKEKAEHWCPVEKKSCSIM